MEFARDSLDEQFRRFKKNIEWSEKMTNSFFWVESENKEIVDNLEIYLKDYVFLNKNNDLDIHQIKVLDLSYFNPDTYYDNHQNLLSQLDNSIYIIDCTNVRQQSNNKTLGQLSSFYYSAKDVKTNFIYVFKNTDANEYGMNIEPWQMRTMTFNQLEDDLTTYRLYKDMQAKYPEKKIKEKKSKI